MNIFITVGTTKFPLLIEYLDSYFGKTEHTVVAQTYVTHNTKNIQSFEFAENINHYYMKSDIIICHAGAGTIYHLLESKKKVIVVPNLNRKDSHQLDIATFLENNNLAFVAYKLQKIPYLIEKIKKHTFNTYENNSNPLIKAISDIITSDLP